MPFVIVVFSDHTSLTFLEEKYLLKLNNVFQTSSKRFVETPPFVSFDVVNYVPFCV